MKALRCAKTRVGLPQTELLSTLAIYHPRGTLTIERNGWDMDEPMNTGHTLRLFDVNKHSQMLTILEERYKIKLMMKDGAI